MQDAIDSPTDHDLTQALSSVFGFRSFRPHQEGIVRAVLQQQDVFAVMPTGGGKSLCYQLPAHLLGGTCVVVSPLISLMQDQVEAARDNGLRAEFINSALDSQKRSEVFRKLVQGKVDLLYIAPERLTMPDFLSFLKTLPICLFAIDEAHCISEWGHQFRPDYLSLSLIAEDFPNVPIAAFTATATERVQDDIISRLNLREPYTLRASFDRPNLNYQIIPKGDVHEQILSFVKEHSGESGIIYRTTRENVESTAAFLRQKGVQAIAYHAGLDTDVRAEHQDQFNRDQAEIVVATIAFGMGIDKSNVRFVIHGDLPKNMESYYQETGRAGRDGEPAECLLFFGRGDVPRIRYFIEQIEDDNERAVASSKLNDMVQFATIHLCRRRQILAYFQEKLSGDNCGNCDVCTQDMEEVDVTEEAQMVMSAIARTGQGYGASHVVDVVVGANTQRIRQLGHDNIKTYGIGKGRAKKFWREILDNLIAHKCVAQTSGQYPVVQLTQKGGEILFGRESFRMLRKKETRRIRLAESHEGEYNRELFEKLRQLRRDLAFDRNVPPFVIFSDRTLKEMARDVPVSTNAIRQITGVGQTKLRRYGDDFLEVIRTHVKQNGGTC